MLQKEKRERDIQKLREIDRARHGTRKERQWIGRKDSGKASELGKRVEVEVESAVEATPDEQSTLRPPLQQWKSKGKAKQTPGGIDKESRGRREKETLEASPAKNGALACGLVARAALQVPPSTLRKSKEGGRLVGQGPEK